MRLQLTNIIRYFLFVFDTTILVFLNTQKFPYILCSCIEHIIKISTEFFSVPFMSWYLLRNVYTQMSYFSIYHTFHHLLLVIILWFLPHCLRVSLVVSDPCTVYLAFCSVLYLVKICGFFALRFYFHLQVIPRFFISHLSSPLLNTFQIHNKTKLGMFKISIISFSFLILYFLTPFPLPLI